MDLQEYLIELNKKLIIIENQNDDFQTDKKWQALREEQDGCYVELAKLRARQFKNRFEASNKQKDLEKMKFYEDFIRRFEDGRNNKNNIK